MNYPPVIKHGLLGNPQSEWRFIARKITDQWSIFQQAMLDYWRVMDLNGIDVLMILWDFNGG